ncbi:serine/threonine-protein kinase AtPK2/AtPK19-like [Diospyros lotus]|uniref:serine/threonine-protein kinase AtPK2/AtPK19-like n=1 Tax=Diospyros lotus TaxID=55363 RepID=UPI0022580F0F|nr:serine/threonine-protein kinase AtPK2/AtPK19-like [Diospyros lotus]XP_052183461.1 serine/threonine-protein kinase AtPK2/AtPK19-like [Diospyros lotus]XP_052183463.1 serine/threonine-protein kinase AtPK2/AtPK19-like [Diospyros lotus]
MVSSTSQKDRSHLCSKLSKLTIPEFSSSPEQPDFDFSEVFGHPAAAASSSSPSSSSSPLNNNNPQIIHNRSHSFVGPSPRFAPASLPFKLFHDPELDEEDEGGEEDGIRGKRGEEAAARKIGPGEFEILRVVGKGAFGKVFQVRMKMERDDDGIGDGDGIFAMKVMRKETIIKNNHVNYMIAERDILTKVVHPFIVQLRYSFQTRSKLYLILDFLNGGHLFFHLYRQGVFSEDQARLYTAEIVSAVSHLHKCGIVHRDLKPENILMDADGHVMLTDFGLAKEIDQSSRSNSMCGTTEYMAPEILLSKGHNKDADWWSVGILLFEMLTGQPPFTHANRKKLQEKIIKERVKLPPRLTSEAHSLLKGLLQKEPSRRLGRGPKGADEIKNHKWFRSINWKKLDARELEPKFKPHVNGKDCTANFDKCWTAMPPDDSPAATPTAGECFQGYTYVAPNPWLHRSS